MTVLTRSVRVVEAELVNYRRTWRGTVISSFVNPVLFLSSLGIGLGTFVDSSQADLGMPYLTFVATGLVAASAMQAGASDGAFPVMAGIKWRKGFFATITTPVGPADIVYGRFLWAAIRITFILVVFVVISAMFGALDWQSALLAVPPGVLTGLAFVTCTTAFTVTRENETSLSTLFRFGITPLFLFSGTFFPISQLPDYLKPIAYATPLFHGVELVRKVSIPGIDERVVTPLPAWVSAAYLLAMTAIGMVLATRWLDRRIRS
jgi:lipooligosaccharide transport system permease protein